MSYQPYTLMGNDLLYYLHIPKTAGTSFTDFISKQFHATESHPPQHISAFLKTPRTVLDNYKFIAGHFFYNVDAFMHRKPVYITMLRDPLERTISHYSHVRRSPAHYAYPIVKSQSLLEFARDPRTQPLYANMQARYIGLNMNYPEIIEKLASNQYQGLELEQQMEAYAPNGYFDPTILEQAQERLTNFAFVGLAEHFDKSIDLLAHTFGWELQQETRNLNIGVNRPAPSEISQDAIDIIRENTQLSSSLYEQARVIFEQRYNQMVDTRSELKLQKITPSQINISTPQNQLAAQQRIIEQLKAEIAYLEKRAANDTQEINRLSAIENSDEWKLAARLSAFRRKYIPQGSKREKLYLRFFNRYS